MSASEDIFDSCMSRLSGVELPLLQGELKHAVEEFFRTSTAWRQAIEIKLLAGKTKYMVTTPHPLVRVESVIDTGTSSGARYATTAYDSKLMTGSSRLVFEPPTTVRLHVAPTEDGLLSFDVVLVPSSYEAIPEQVLARHREALTHGLLSRLCGMPGKPWSSEKLTAYHARKAANMANDAKRQVERGYGGPSWTFPPFA
jgi:hypothetical protein